MVKSKKQKMAEKQVMFCYRCKSIHIVHDIPLIRNGNTPPIVYICKDCGSHGPFPTILESKISDLKNEAKRIGKVKYDNERTDKGRSPRDILVVRIITDFLTFSLLVLGIFVCFRKLSLGISMIILSLIIFYFSYTKKNDSYWFKV